MSDIVTDGVWEEARKVAKDQLAEAALSQCYDHDFPSMNPYEGNDPLYEEWEAAHEHYIMTGLGY